MNGRNKMLNIGKQIALITLLVSMLFTACQKANESLTAHISLQENMDANHV